VVGAVIPLLRLGLEVPSVPVSGGEGPDRAARPAARFHEVVVAAEAAGFNAVWIDEVDGSCDGCTLAGAMAPCTSSLVLGVVAGLGKGFRNPSILARDVTTLDVLSGGRAAVLLRSGDVPPDALEEAVWVLHALCVDDAPTVSGRFFGIEEAANRPGPVRTGGPPVLVEESPSRTAGVAWDRSEVDGGGSAAWARVLDGDITGIERKDTARRFWRGDFDPSDDAAAMARAIEAGAVDGVIVRLARRGDLPAPGDVAEAGRRLVSIVPRSEA
jgi:hypothetical protein